MNHSHLFGGDTFIAETLRKTCRTWTPLGGIFAGVNQEGYKEAYTQTIRGRSPQEPNVGPYL
jgi:hypothetical protein